MTVSVHIDLGYEFEVKARYDEVFAVLSDVPRSVSHFPRWTSSATWATACTSGRCRRWAPRR